MVGRLLFQNKQQKLLALQVSTTIQTNIAKILTPPQNFTEAILAKLKHTIIDEITALPGVEHLPSKRVVHPTYRGRACNVKTESLTDEVGLHVAAAWKGRAVEAGLLPNTFMDDIIVPPSSKSGCGAIVSKGVLAEALAARERLASIYANAVVTSAEQVHNMIIAKKTDFAIV